jgi:hypothetical protein
MPQHHPHGPCGGGKPCWRKSLRPYTPSAPSLLFTLYSLLFTLYFLLLTWRAAPYSLLAHAVSAVNFLGATFVYNYAYERYTNMFN